MSSTIVLNDRKGFKATDLALVGLIVAVVVLMVIPIPVILLDALIAVNIMLSLALLMMSAYVPSALSLSTFPTLLLFTTLLRLSLNIASTKAILLHGDAGEIIETFGRLVVGGNVFVGLVIFIIIAIVQFIVIAKGSERVAEVGARFSLDGMPGKQMSIDADLRSGILTKEVAQAKRTQLEKESQLGGAMDGAMKFVKGDAIAGLVITAVNIIGGISVGMLMHNLSIGDSSERYVLLSVGDGMVSQIPSLFVSIAAGILITRVASAGEGQSDLGSDVSRQLTAQPTALFFTGVVMVLFVTVPGFPKLVFVGLGGLLVAFALFTRSRLSKPKMVEETPVAHFGRDGALQSSVFISNEDKDGAQPLALELCADDLPLIDVRAFDNAMAALRASVRRQSGLPFPGLTVRLSPELQPGQARVLVNEVPVGDGSVDWGRPVLLKSLFPGSEPVRDIFAVEAPLDNTVEAGTGRPLSGIEAQPEQYLACVVGRAWVRDGEFFVGMQEVQRMLDATAKTHPGLVEEVMRTLPLQRVTDVYRRLVQEQASIFHQREILESLIVWGPREKDVVMLTEYVRVDLGRMTAHRHARGLKLLPCVVVSAGLEAEIRGAIQQSQVGNYLALTPDQSQRAIQAFEAALHASGRPLSESIVVCSMDIRRYVRKLLMQSGLALPVLSHQELGMHVQIQPLAQVDASPNEPPAIDAPYDEAQS